MMRQLQLVLLTMLLSATARGADAPQRDRKAILAMAGGYRVTFDFRETIVLQSGYKPHEPHQSKAIEWVEVVEDSQNRIQLQHLLVANGKVVKHWRQDWVYENRMLNEYQGHGRWRPRTLDAQAVKGTWTQRVSQVDDSPRYESFGRWSHEAGGSSWESGWTWRPMPRREHTERSDYQVIIGRNRQTLTPGGWVHEQDNRKVVLGADGSEKSLVRELGINTYELVEDARLEPAREYWRKHGAFWGDVRVVWEDVLQGGRPVKIFESDEGEKLQQAIWGLCSADSEGQTPESAERRKRIREVIERHIVTEAAAVEGR